MVAPCYYLACRMFVDAGLGAGLSGVPEGEGGVDLEVLRRGLEECGGEDFAVSVLLLRFMIHDRWMS